MRTLRGHDTSASGFDLGGSCGHIDQSWAVRNVQHGYVIHADGVAATRSWAVQNGGDGLAIGAFSSEFTTLRTKGNGGFGIRARGAFNYFYDPNYCQGDRLGDSDPPGLCK